jgi:hypothetical protein
MFYSSNRIRIMRGGGHGQEDSESERFDGRRNIYQTAQEDKIDLIQAHHAPHHKLY